MDLLNFDTAETLEFLTYFGPPSPNEVFFKSARYGRLTFWDSDEIVLTSTGKLNQDLYYFMRCDCRNFKKVLGSSLVSGATQSCGCLRREKASERMSTASSKGRV
jgi:hypothetical protein